MGGKMFQCVTSFVHPGTFSMGPYEIKTDMLDLTANLPALLLGY
jgi:hypothetical protein